MLRLRVQRLRPRTQTKTHYRGSEQFELVLLLTSLEQGQLYVASEIAAMAVDRKQEPARYKRVKDSLYQRANRYGIVETNQNVDKYGRQQHPAKWDADHWAASLNDRDWMRAYHFYEALYERDQSNRHLGRNLHYYFDDDIGLIETEADTIQQVKALLKLGSWHRYAFWEHHTVVTMLIDPQQIQQQVTRLPGPATDGSVQDEDQPTRPVAQPSWPLRTVLAAMVCIAALVWLVARPSETARELERLAALQQSQEPAAIQHLSSLLQDEDSTLDPDWVVQAILDKIGAYPSDTNLALLRQLYRNRTTYRSEIVKRIAEMNMVIDFNPLFPRTPSRPVFIAAIDENPVILYEEGYLRPGDWMNFNYRTGYVTQINPGFIVINAQDMIIEIPMASPDLLGKELRRPYRILAFEGKQNLRPILQTIGAITDIEYIDQNITGHLGGGFQSNSYQEFLSEIAERSSLMISDRHILPQTSAEFIIILGDQEIILRRMSPVDLVGMFAYQSGIQIVLDSSVQLPTERIEFIKYQWPDFLDQFNLICAFEPEMQRLTLSSLGGQLE